MAKIIRIDADEVMAGDRIVIKEGSIRKYRHVCEVQVKQGQVHIIYNVPNGFEHLHLDANERVRVRDD